MNDRRVRSSRRITRSAFDGIERIGQPDVGDAGVSKDLGLPSFAQQMPTAPRSICHFAICGLLCVLLCGRRRIAAVSAACLHAIHVREQTRSIDQDRWRAKSLESHGAIIPYGIATVTYAAAEVRSRGESQATYVAVEVFPHLTASSTVFAPENLTISVLGYPLISPKRGPL